MGVLKNVGDNAGVFGTLFDPAKGLLGSLAYIFLEILGYLSIIGGIIALIMIITMEERRKQGVYFFIICVTFALLKFGGSIKDFLNGIGQ